MNFELILRKQNKFKEKHNKFFQVLVGGKHPKLRDGSKSKQEEDGLDLSDLPKDIEIHEHFCPNSEVGFSIIEKKTETGNDFIKRTGYGCGSQTHDWQVIEKL